MRSYYPVNCQACGRSLRVPEKIVPPLWCSCGVQVAIPADVVLVTIEEFSREHAAADHGIWVSLVKRFRKPQDRGVGDTVQRLAARLGGERFKKLSARLGIPCGCTARQQDWNERWPY